MFEFLSIVMLIFGLLQIILFFKIWGMTNNVFKIKTILSDADDKPNWKTDFCILVASGKKEDAKFLLLKNMVNDTSFRNIIISKSDVYKNQEKDNLYKKYSVFLEQLGLNISDIDFDNPMYKEIIK